MCQMRTLGERGNAIRVRRAYPAKGRQQENRQSDRLFGGQIRQHYDKSTREAMIFTHPGCDQGGQKRAIPRGTRV